MTPLCSLCYSATALLMILSTRCIVSVADPCNSDDWGDTIGKCCRDDGGTSASENSLSVVHCNSLASVEGTDLVELSWNQSTIQGNLMRIFLFSHCINPTNTSLTSVTSLLYSSAGSHLRSSTVLSYSQPSSCSYFGCYNVGFFGITIYTFSEVSCLASATSSASPPGISSTRVFVYPELTSEIDLPLPTNTSTLLWPTASSLITASFTSKPPISSSLLEAAASSGSVMEEGTMTSVILTPTVSTPSPSLPDGTPPSEPHLWILIGAPLLIFIIAAAVALCFLLVFMCYYRNCRYRDIGKDMKNVTWYDLQTINYGEVNNLPVKFREVDTRSLHSLQTLYESMFEVNDDVGSGGVESSRDKTLVPSSALHTSTDDEGGVGGGGDRNRNLASIRRERQDEEGGESGGETSVGSSNKLDDDNTAATSSGISTCPSDTYLTTDCENSNFTTTSFSSQCDTSYVLYDGSLLTLSPELNRSGQPNSAQDSINPSNS